MKDARQHLWIWLLLGACCATAQTNITPGTTSGQVYREGTVIVPETLPKASDNLNPSVIVSRPQLAERNKLPREVAARIEAFQKEAKTYLQKREELEKKLQAAGATDTQRALIREQLAQLREQQLERSRQLKQEFKERERELSEKMLEYRELLDNVRSAARDQLRTTREETKPRRGVD
jgi:hypothetical protein